MSTEHLPGQMDFATLEAHLARYDGASVSQQRNIAHALFYSIALDPAYGRIVGWKYCQQKFANHSLYHYLLAGLAYGEGRVEEAFNSLHTLSKQHNDALAALLAGVCYLRPNGRELNARHYLMSAQQRFPSDIAISITLAQAHFVLGEATKANEILARIKPQWQFLLESYAKEHQDLHEEISQACAKRIVNRQTHYDDTIYAELHIQQHWEPYYRDMLGEPSHLFFGWMRQFYISAFDDVLRHAPHTDAIINFGVMCGQADYESALKYPQVNYYGVDRQVATKTLNDMAFCAANLEFLAGDIESFIPHIAQKHSNAALFHARTATLLYPERVRNLYKLCAQHGIKHISVFENLGPNHYAGCYFDYADFPQDAIIYKNHQFIHHYPRFLEEAGYRVLTEQRIASPSVQADSAIDWGSAHVYLHATFSN